MTWQKAAAIAAVLAVIGTGTSWFLKYHANFALADQVQKVSNEFTYYRLSNEAAAIQTRLWQLKDRHKCEVDQMPQSSKEEYRRLEGERNRLLIKVQALESKQ